MPHLGQELHNELNLIGLTRIFSKKFLLLSLSLIENKEKNLSDIFKTKFTYLDKELTEISPELTSSMSIVLHLRNTYHGILQSRRAILFDIILYLSDKAKLQVN
jgi:hypothetical protein